MVRCRRLRDRMIVAAEMRGITTAKVYDSWN